ncbi:hypothetical protein EDD37DRAFT_385264 [Exophiala viscosa]|uniref:uncharacterized protein n=1 Tax=Exophiala viscosa TaxID=2486360 RepID=UPI0021A1A5EE|nr:hypothetical protein EDD37DRAFT_385264 [Exophiala viscosa]
MEFYTTIPFHILAAEATSKVPASFMSFEPFVASARAWPSVQQHIVHPTQPRHKRGTSFKVQATLPLDLALVQHLMHLRPRSTTTVCCSLRSFFTRTEHVCQGTMDILVVSEVHRRQYQRPRPISKHITPAATASSPQLPTQPYTLLRHHMATPVSGRSRYRYALGSTYTKSISKDLPSGIASRLACCASISTKFTRIAGHEQDCTAKPNEPKVRIQPV